MALQGAFTLKSGIEVTSVYLRVERVIINPKKNVPDAEILYVVYKNNLCEGRGEAHLLNVFGANFDNYFRYDAIDPLNRNPQERAYTYLKTIYTDMVDA